MEREASVGFYTSHIRHLWEWSMQELHDPPIILPANDQKAKSLVCGAISKSPRITLAASPGRIRAKMQARS